MIGTFALNSEIFGSEQLLVDFFFLIDMKEWSFVAGEPVVALEWCGILRAW